MAYEVFRDARRPVGPYKEVGVACGWVGVTYCISKVSMSLSDMELEPTVSISRELPALRKSPACHVMSCDQLFMDNEIISFKIKANGTGFLYNNY